MDLILINVPAKPPITVWASKLKRLSHLNGYSHLDTWYLALRHSDAMHKRAATWRHATNLFMNAQFTHQMSMFTEGFYSIMAKTPPKQKPVIDRPEWKGFVDYRLTDAHLEQFDNTQFDHTAILEAYAGLLVGGYRVTHSYNANNKTFTTTLIDNRPGSSLGGYALSAQGETYFEAWSMLIYKHFIALEQDWSSVVTPERKARRG